MVIYYRTIQYRQQRFFYILYLFVNKRSFTLIFSLYFQSNALALLECHAVNIRMSTQS